MAFVTGTAMSFSDLLTALRNACTANGWALSGNVLHKGTCYVEVLVATIVQSGAPPNGALWLRTGNGIDGANALTDTVTTHCQIGRLKNASAGTWPDWDWPVSYHVHVLSNPDEVYFLVNYGAGQTFQWLAFGQSPAPGNPGTGNWHTASLPPRGNFGSNDGFFEDDHLSLRPDGGWFSRSRSRGGYIVPAPFWWAENRPNNFGTECRLNGRIHGAFSSSDSFGHWSDEYYSLETATAAEFRVSAAVTARPLLRYSPNSWNNETVLVPIQILQQRPDSKASVISEFGHIRMCRNDFINPGDVISLGSESWKVYPCYRRDAATRDGGIGLTHSGTIAMAIRYDGP